MIWRLEVKELKSNSFFSGKNVFRYQKGFIIVYELKNKIIYIYIGKMFLLILVFMLSFLIHI